MTLDWWGLGLQAINVLILVWLLSRVFWRPVADAITRRQEAAQAMLDEGKTAQAKADAALAEVAEARAGIAAERDAMLAEARAAADTVAKAALKDAQTKADALIAPRAPPLTATETPREGERGEGRRAFGRDCSAAARPVQHARGSGDVPCATCRGDRGHVRLRPRGADSLGRWHRDRHRDRPGDAERAEIEQAVKDALGGTPSFRLVTDPEPDRRTGTAQRAFRAAQQLAGRS